MPEALLASLSQAGLGIAGFAGIAIVLIAKGHPEWVIKQQTGIKAMLETSLTVMIFSLLPLTLDFIVSDVDVGLAYLSVIFGLWHLFFFALALRRGTFLWGEIHMLVLIVLSILVILIQLIVPLAGSSEYLIDAYLLGLFWLLIASSQNFVALIYSSFTIED